VTERPPLAIFRADASAGIGTGHVMRCRTLADALVARGWRATLVAEHLPAGLASGWPGGESAIVRLEHVPSPEAEPPEIADRLGHDADLVVGDHYAHGAGWFEGMRHEQNGAVVLAIDDLANRFLPVDIVLNQNLGVMEADYAAIVSRGARVLTGPRFALLRPGFAELRDRRRRRDGRVDRILVFVSGADPADVTGRATKALETLDRAIDVVVGSAYTNIVHLRATVSQMPRATLHVNTPEMAALMDKADLAIGAPSSASWERCALGLPAILITLADNQVGVGQHLQEAGAALSLGWHESVTSADIESAVRALVEDPPRVHLMSQHAAAITDGRGTERLAGLVEAMVSGRMVRR
jgi:UDP-2,4-diacetamido-2,4,6-trideoxy-beta-L-altropyranose hydrolase